MIEARCLQHSWTRGYIGVFDHPYFVVTEATGAERDRLWNDHVAQLPEFGEYPKKTDRVIPMLLVERAA